MANYRYGNSAFLINLFVAGKSRIVINELPFDQNNLQFFVAKSKSLNYFVGGWHESVSTKWHKRLILNKNDNIKKKRSSRYQMIRRILTSID